jgi:Tol biopolymer transport system component
VQNSRNYILKFALRAALSLLLLLAAATFSNAQQFGGNPPSVHYRQINTPAARVIYPDGLDSSASRVANIIQKINNAVQPTIGNKQKQINIVLQNQTTVANAYVGLAPFRSEFYLTPEQNNFDIGSLPWPGQLAIHEFRHVQQYNNFNVGVSHLLKVLFGEGGQALANDLVIPNWFFEGDAVYNETHVSGQGRGRLPYFFNGYRALWTADKKYSWQKLRNGSYRDYTPDWYATGYMLVAYGYEKYGAFFWKNVTHDAAAYKGGLYPLQRAIKTYAGLSFEAFRDSALTHFKQQFHTDQRVAEQGPGSVSPRHFVADQEFPAFVNDSSLVYLKSTYRQPAAFVVQKGNQVKKIRVRSAAIDNYFAYHNGKIVYAAYRPDLRWTYRDYSELQMLDAASGAQRRLTKSSKYFSPDFSNDGKTLVAVYVPPSGKSELHLLDAATGHVKSVIFNPERLFYTYPKFYGDDDLIAAVRNPEGKMSLAMIDIKTGATQYLLPFAYQPIGFIHLDKDTVYFTATSGVSDRLYKLSVADKRLFELQDFSKPGAIGSYQVAVSDKHIAWVGLTAAGYQVTIADKNKLNWSDLKDARIPGGLPELGINALHRDTAAGLLTTVVNQPLPSTVYHKGYHLFNFHSLFPTLNDPNYAVALVGENVLNTFQSQLLFNYNRDEGYKEIGFEGIYGGLFPYFSGGASYTFDRKAFNKGQNVYFNETNLHGGFELPFNLSADQLNTNLAIGSDIYYSQVNFQPAYQHLYADRSYAYLNNYISFKNSIQQARQNIFPRFGQSISLNFKQGVVNSNATQFLASGSFYFPGLLVNHNIVINAAHQQRGNSNVISYSNDFPFSRGYSAENLHDMNKLGINYHLPLAYPDAGIGNAVYVLRLRGNLFFDYTRAADTYTSGRPFNANFRSTGMEVYFDTQWFNQTPITFGIRYSRLLDPDVFGYNGRNRIELIVPVAIFN